MRTCFQYLRYRDKAHSLDINIAEHHRTFEQLGVEIARYQEAIKNCEAAELKYRRLAQDLGEVGNDPLTWDELKQMEGKPVWIECEYYFCPRWVILTNVYDEKAMFIGDGIVDSELKEEMGKTWQAYRKERE